MSTHDPSKQDGDANPAVAARLRQLADMPVDLSRMERVIQAQVHADDGRRVLWISRGVRPMRAVAASVALMAVVATLLVTASGGPVLASASEMAKFHYDLVSGSVPVMQVDSISAANKAIAAQWKQSPALPGMPEDHAMACCMRSVKNKKVACVLLRDDGEPITMTVANASDMQLPKSPVQSEHGVEYHVQATGDLNMVMTERDGRWVCLIAKLPVGRLMELASSLRF